jgi:serine/threonine protein kinase
MSDYQPNKIIPGTVYQVIQLLGLGGMGTVYEVEDTTVGKRYVLKTLHAQLRDRKELAARLHKEARTLARLSHPNIVEVVTAGMTADSLKLPYFVMQKLNGHTLRSVLSAKGCLPLETAYSIAIDLLDALDHAHAIGVIHRDVKPENIFLHRGPNDTHQTKLLDFGVMRMLSSDQPQTGARFVGTLRYAPPEQLRGGHVTQRTDLYSAALVLFEMIAGGGPFDDETTDRGIANAHLEKAAPALTTRMQVPPELDALVASALAKNPDARPRDAFTFASALRKLSREAASARGSASLHGVDWTIGSMGAPPSATNLNDATDVASHHSRPRATTLENAGPPTEVPQTTLRMEPVRDAIDRSAPTRTAAPMGDVRSDPPRVNVTTTGAIESHASEIPVARRGPVVATAIALVAVAVLGLGVGARWMRGRAQATRAAPSATAIPTTTAIPTATATATPTANANPTPNATATPNANPTPNATATATPNATTPPPAATHASPRRAPTPAPTASAHPKSRLPPSDL